MTYGTFSGETIDMFAPESQAAPPVAVEDVAPRYVGIVGHEAAKFTSYTEREARRIIAGLLDGENTVLVSGRSPLGGVDVWAEEVAEALQRRTVIFPPTARQWEGAGGFKERNQQIADASHELHCIVVAQLPPEYRGMRFPKCYHCDTDEHVKSGGCWTVRRGMAQGKPGHWHVIREVAR